MTNASALDGLFRAAQKSARQRQQPPSTGHVLLTAMLSDPECGRVLVAEGVRESDVLSALKVVGEEPGTTLDVAVERATVLAHRVGANHLRPIHVLHAILNEQRSMAYKCLEQMGLSAGRVREHVFAAITATIPQVAEPPSPPPRGPIFAPRASTPSPRPTATAPRSMTTMSAATDARGATATPSPRPTTIAPTAARPVAKNVRTETRPAPRNEKRAEPAAEPKPALGPFELDEAAFPVLRQIGRNLTALAAAGAVDPVFGRDVEIEALLDVLARRRSNNPLLVGPPGVGKTAIAEGLAVEMARSGAQLSGLGGKILIEVSAGSLVSGTGVRGALGDKLRKLREEIARSEGRVLLFLDEIHAIVSGESGPDDLASELKSALARGELPCIGATTDAEYRKHFERDPALARRFTRIDVGEPSAAASIEILRGLAPRYEEHHHVTFDAEAIRAAVELSVRFLPERHLPDKALSAMDLAAARVRRAGKSVVDREAIAKVIADEAHVPLERLMMRDADVLLKLEEHLAQQVVGQRAPLARICEALRKGAAGFRGKRPLGTFLLLGPTGVGKTETAKAIADRTFGPGGMSRFDMSEYGEPHTVARLLGAPPGYVGHDAGGQLTECVRRRPYQLVLLDEIEKAHPDVLLALLPLLDEGRLTDGRGRTVDFTNTVIVMTSNLGVREAAAPVARSLGFGAIDAAPASDTSVADRAMAAARRAMPPELWNRIDEPLWFGALSEDDVREIARRMVVGVAAVLQREHAIELRADESAIEALVRGGGFEASLGARPMRRTVGRMIESPLASRILAREITRGDRVLATRRGDAIAFVPESVADAAE